MQGRIFWMRSLPCYGLLGFRTEVPRLICRCQHGVWQGCRQLSCISVTFRWTRPHSFISLEVKTRCLASFSLAKYFLFSSRLQCRGANTHPQTNKGKKRFLLVWNNNSPTAKIRKVVWPVQLVLLCWKHLPNTNWSVKLWEVPEPLHT